MLPTNCSLYVRLRFNLFNGESVSKSSLLHADDFEWALQRRFVDKGEEVPANGYSDSDDGSDAKYIGSDKFKLVWSRVLRKYKMGVIIMSGPAHNKSSDNDIEACWSPLKVRLSGLVMPDLFDDDELSPIKQTTLSKEQRIYKETAIYESSARCLMETWSSVRWAGRPVTVDYVLPQVRPIYIIYDNCLMSSYYW